MNVGQTTYARVLYSNAGIAALVEHMTLLSAADRLGLMNDTLALGLAGYTRATNVLALVKALPMDADPIVWQGAIGMLRNLDIYFSPGADKVAYRLLALGLLHPLADRLGDAGRSGEGSDVEILRAFLLRTLGEFGDPAVIAWAARSLHDHTWRIRNHHSRIECVGNLRFMLLASQRCRRARLN